MNWLRSLRLRLRQWFCRHEFHTSDLTLTGIKPLSAPPRFAPWPEHRDYFFALDKHPSHTKRVHWPCRKCGKSFHAHCGLEILSKHGKIVT